MIDKINKESALNEHNPYTTQQQEPAARRPGGSLTKIGHGSKIILKQFTFE
jgi:hypothetical protein